ncbi:hypothetical protein PG996_013785 [Apiospora saccharicola]|uniref:F-box domain-containing protein n=1 Tax=Apiospora saccharicola TaxID=335842 RepID=A0ABR1TGG1_9PEZI
MRNLPLEIVDRIVDFLPIRGQVDAPRQRTPEGEGCCPRLAPYATVSPNSSRRSSVASGDRWTSATSNSKNARVISPTRGDAA